jgi:hypothetical protein
MVFDAQKFIVFVRGLQDPELSSDTINQLEQFVKKYQVDINHCDNNGNSILHIACAKNSVGVIEYLIKECSMDLNHLNKNGNSILGLACARNNSTKVIEYLIKECSMDLSHLNKNGNSILGLACALNESVKVIEYLIKECSMDLNHLDKNGNSILGLACANNQSVNVIEYLIKECSMVLSHLNKNENPILGLACRFNRSVNVIKYLMEIKDIEININGMSADKCRKIIVLEWKDQKKYNDLVDQIIDKHGAYLIMRMIDQINILTLYPDVREMLFLSDPLELRFDKFKQLVDDLKMCVQIPDTNPLDPSLCESESESLDQMSEFLDTCSDQKQEIIFMHNKIPYRGNPKTVLNALELTRGMGQIFCSHDEPIVLTSELSGGPMDKWVRSIDKKMDISNIGLEDLVPLLNHINKYPTLETTLVSIEYEVIHLLDSMRLSGNNVLSNLEEFAQSHEMKLLYLHLHNIGLRSGDSSDLDHCDEI